MNEPWSLVTIPPGIIVPLWFATMLGFSLKQEVVPEEKDAFEEKITELEGEEQQRAEDKAAREIVDMERKRGEALDAINAANEMGYAAQSSIRAATDIGADTTFADSKFQKGVEKYQEAAAEFESEEYLTAKTTARESERWYQEAIMEAGESKRRREQQLEQEAESEHQEQEEADQEDDEMSFGKDQGVFNDPGTRDVYKNQDDNQEQAQLVFGKIKRRNGIMSNEIGCIIPYFGWPFLAPPPGYVAPAPQRPQPQQQSQQNFIPSPMPGLLPPLPLPPGMPALPPPPFMPQPEATATTTPPPTPPAPAADQQSPTDTEESVRDHWQR